MIPGFDPKNHYFMPLETAQAVAHLKEAHLEEASPVIDLTPKGEKKPPGLALKTVTLLRRAFQQGTLIINLDCTVDQVAREILRGYSNKLGWCGWLWGRARELAGKESEALANLRHIADIVVDIEQLCRTQSRADRGVVGIRKALYQLSVEQSRQEGGSFANKTPLQAARIREERLRPSLDLFKMEDIIKETGIERDTALVRAISYLSVWDSSDAAPRYLGEAVELLGYSFFQEQTEQATIDNMEKLLGITGSSRPTIPAAQGKDTVPTKGRAGARLAHGKVVVQAPPSQNPFTAYHLGALSNRVIVLAKLGFFNAACRIASSIKREHPQGQQLTAAIMIGRKAQEALDRCKTTGSFSEQGKADMMTALTELGRLQGAEYIEITIGYIYQLFGLKTALFENLLDAMMAKDGKGVALKAIEVWPHLTQTEREQYRAKINPDEACI